MDNPELALTEVNRQRAAMAARIRLPWWFLALFALTWTAMVAGPSLVEVGMPLFPYSFLGVGVLIVLLVVFRRWSGMHLAWRNREYPSLRRRRQVIGLVAVLMGVPALSWTCYFLGAPVFAVALAAVGGVLAADQCRRVNAGIRADVLAGR